MTEKKMRFRLGSGGGWEYFDLRVGRAPDMHQSHGGILE